MKRLFVPVLLLLLLSGICLSLPVHATALTVTINPTSAYFYVGQSRTFYAYISGGTPPYVIGWWKSVQPVGGSASTVSGSIVVTVVSAQEMGLIPEALTIVFLLVAFAVGSYGYIRRIHH